MMCCLQSNGGQGVFPERFIARTKYTLIESLLEDFGSEADCQTLRDALPPLVADHEIRLVGGVVSKGCQSH
jgi:hypothetical protein